MVKSSSEIKHYHIHMYVSMTDSDRMTVIMFFKHMSKILLCTRQVAFKCNEVLNLNFFFFTTWCFLDFSFKNLCTSL